MASRSKLSSIRTFGVDEVMITYKRLELMELVLRELPRPAESFVMEAATTLGTFYHHTGNREIAALLATLIRDSSLQESNRLHVYLLLLEVIGVPIESFPASLATFRLERDARWDIVNQFL